VQVKQMVTDHALTSFHYHADGVNIAVNINGVTVVLLLCYSSVTVLLQ
jgi:hypothetical protein